MTTYYWNDWYTGWGWFLWFGVLFLLFSAFGNWGYTYSAHRRLGTGNATKDAMTILNERLAKGEINEGEYLRIKAHIAPTENFVNTKVQEKSVRAPGPLGTPVSSNM